MNKTSFRDLLKKNNPYLEDDVIDYSFVVLKQYSLFILILSPISIITHLFFYSCLFISLFVPLRKTIGGLHFEKSIACLFVSITITLIISFLSKNIYLGNIHTKLVIMIFIITAMFIINPTDHKNKVVNFQEKKRFKKKSLIVLFIYLFLTLIFEFMNLIKISNMILLVSLISVANNYLAVLLNHVRKKQ